jgi:hypothetical protein
MNPANGPMFFKVVLPVKRMVFNWSKYTRTGNGRNH